MNLASSLSYQILMFSVLHVLQICCRLTTDLHAFDDLNMKRYEDLMCCQLLHLKPNTLANARKHISVSEWFGDTKIWWPSYHQMHQPAYGKTQPRKAHFSMRGCATVFCINRGLATAELISHLATKKNRKPLSKTPNVKEKNRHQGSFTIFTMMSCMIGTVAAETYSTP